MIYCTSCIHSCNASLLSNVAHRVNILAETFLIAIKKCLLSCLVGSLQNNDSIVARFAGSFCKLFWLSCSLSESSFMNINTCSCIESVKQQLSHYSNLHVCAEEAEGEVNVPILLLLSSFWMLSIQGSGFYCFPVISPGHRPWMSSPPWVDIFWTSHASIIYSLG